MRRTLDTRSLGFSNFGILRHTNLSSHSPHRSSVTAALQFQWGMDRFYGRGGVPRPSFFLDCALLRVSSFFMIVFRLACSIPTVRILCIVYIYGETCVEVRQHQ